MTTITRPGVGHRTAHDPGDPLVTSHCPFCGSGQVVGRSDGTISCDFCGQAYIVRVQPAFPGMPQMPMGPGAASDVGPDGGLMDPSMIGPDGMPADEEGGPPPADATEDPAEGEEGGPPDEDGGEEEESAPPPPKGKKKAARRYLGVQGQILTEEQLVRHIAVVASGGDPKVMALLRSTARRKTAAPGVAINESAMPYRQLPTGHQVSVGRHGRDWYGMITHPATHQIHLMHVGDREPEDVHPEIERQLASPTTRAFIHATGPEARGEENSRYRDHPGEWYRGTGPGHSPSDFRPAIGSRRPFGRAATRIEHNHEDMPPEYLRQHMRDQHGFLDSPDDPDWLVDETHRNEHADAPLEHSHPDLDAWDEDEFHLGDRDWLNQHGFEASRQAHKDANVRDLASLRAHMKADHDFDVAGMIPQRTLLGLHEDDHAQTDPKWYGSSDASRGPGFIAMLTSNSYGDPEREDVERRGAESFERAGLGKADDWGPYRVDTGHMLAAGYTPEYGWQMHVYHPASSTDERGSYGKVISTHLGHDHDRVGEHALRFFRRPDVLSAMSDQMKPGDWDSGEGPWFTRGHREM